MRKRKENMIDRRERIEFYEPTPSPQVEAYVPERPRKNINGLLRMYYFIIMLLFLGFLNACIAFGAFVFLFSMYHTIFISLFLALFLSGYIVALLAYLMFIDLKGGNTNGSDNSS